MAPTTNMEGSYMEGTQVLEQGTVSLQQALSGLSQADYIELVGIALKDALASANDNLPDLADGSFPWYDFATEVRVVDTLAKVVELWPHVQVHVTN